MRKSALRAHAFVVVEEGASLNEALCGARMRLDDLQIVNPTCPPERCPVCDQVLRDMGGPHPQLDPAGEEARQLIKSGLAYEPRWTFEDWEAGSVP